MGDKLTSKGESVLNGRNAVRWLGTRAQYGERVLGTI